MWTLYEPLAKLMHGDHCVEDQRHDEYKGTHSNPPRSIEKVLFFIENAGTFSRGRFDGGETR